MSESSAFLNIDTPENVVFGYELAGLGSRFLAAFIDTTIILILELLGFIVALVISNIFNINNAANWVIAFYGIFAFLILWGYYIVLELLWNGQTVGKRKVNLRVLRVDGRPIGIVESAIRNLIRIVDFFPAGYGLGALMMLIGKQPRRLGDIAAGTLVVYDQGTIALADLSVKADKRPRASLIMADGSEVPKLSSEEMLLVEQFVERQEGLIPFEQLANAILSHLQETSGVVLKQPGTLMTATRILRSLAFGRDEVLV